MAPRPVHPVPVLGAVSDYTGTAVTKPISEADAEDYKRQDREDKGIAHLEERRRREPPMGEPCSKCDGEGRIAWWKHSRAPTTSSDTLACDRCLGTKVEP